MKLRNVSNELLSNIDKIIGISKFIIGFCAACAFAYGFLSAIGLRLKGKSQYYDFSSIAFWFNENLLYVLLVGIILGFILLYFWPRGSHFEERRTEVITQEIGYFDIREWHEIDNEQIKNISSRKMGWKIIFGGILVAFSGPFVSLLYRYSSGELFINWIIIFIASLILIFGSLILAKGLKEYLK